MYHVTFFVSHSWILFYNDIQCCTNDMQCYPMMCNVLQILYRYTRLWMVLQGCILLYNAVQMPYNDVQCCTMMYKIWQMLFNGVQFS